MHVLTSQFPGKWILWLTHPLLSTLRPAPTPSPSSDTVTTWAWLHLTATLYDLFVNTMRCVEQRRTRFLDVVCGC